MNQTLQEYDQIKVELKRAVVGYCDITDFTEWIRISAVISRDITLFLKKMKWTFRKFREKTGYFQIPIGDGIIAIIDSAPENKPVDVLQFVTSLWELGRDLSALADEEKDPRPGKSRIRITAGNTYRTEEPPLAIPFMPVDYIGEPMNLGSRLLQVRRDIPALITNAALELMSPEDVSQLIVILVDFLGQLPRDLSRGDLEGLCEFSVRSGRP